MGRIARPNTRVRGNHVASPTHAVVMSLSSRVERAQQRIQTIEAEELEPDAPAPAPDPEPTPVAVPVPMSPDRVAKLEELLREFRFRL